MQINKRWMKQFFFVDKCLEACEHAVNFSGYFILEHPEDLGVVGEEHPGSIWQWREVLDLIPKCKASCFCYPSVQVWSLDTKANKAPDKFESFRHTFTLPFFFATV